MADKQLQWSAYPRLGDIPEHVNDFLAKSEHGCLFQSPQWYIDVESNDKRSLAVCGCINDAPVIAAIIMTSSLPGTRYATATCRRGPIFREISAAIEHWGELEDFLISQGIICIALQPYWERKSAAELESYLVMRNFQPSTRLSSHSHTLLIALNDEPENILAKTISQKTRNMIRKGTRIGVTVSPAASAEDAHSFWEMHNMMCQKKGSSGPSAEEFNRIRIFSAKQPSACVILLAKLGEELIGGCVILRQGNRAVYTWGSSISKPMKGVPKTELALWHSILWARKSGAAFFDMGGITPGAPLGSASYGVNKFKGGFSKLESHLFPPMEKQLRPTLSRIHQSLQKLKSSLN